MKRRKVWVMAAEVFGLALLVTAAGCRHGGPGGALDRWAAELSDIAGDRLPRDAARQSASESSQAGWFRLTSASSTDVRTRNLESCFADLDSQPPPGERGTGEPPEALGRDHRRVDAEARQGPDEGSEALAERRSRPGPLPGFWETIRRDVREMPDDLWADTKAVYASGPNLVILGLTYGGSLALQEAGPDDTVENSFTRNHHRTFGDDWRDGFAAAGNPGTHFALAGLWYLAGQQRQDEKTYNVGKTLFSALIINGVSTMVGQAASWDRAPNGEWGTFPSGHVSSSFAFASVMHQAYGHWVGIPLYALSGLVAYERLESGEHYLSDVVMGGVMGLVIGHTVAGQHEFKLFGGEVVPYIDPNTNTSGVAWVRHFR